MAAHSVMLLDAEEIERFFVETTGMKPGYLQLSRGPANLRLRSVELPGITLVWCRAETKARWCDEMTGDRLHVGFAIESNGTITSRGKSLDADAAQVWMPGREMDLIMGGPNLTLEIAVDNDLVESLGWNISGDPLKRVSQPQVSRLVRACSRATEAAENQHDPSRPESASAGRSAELWRDQILDLLEPVLEPWLTLPTSKAISAIASTPHYHLVKQGDGFMDDLGYTEPFHVEGLAQSLGIPRRSLFHAYRKVLGIGPRQYFELRRLHRLRQILRNTDESDATVTAVATELGFTDLGRLAANYRRQFGENPSDTLKRVS